MTQSLDLDAVERVKELDLEALEKVAKAVSTPGDIDSAPESGEYGHKERDKWYACPACDGQGEVDGATFCNFDGKPLGVQFFGIGAEFGEWEAYFRAFRPEIALALLSLLREAEKEKAELRRQRDNIEAAAADRMAEWERDRARAQTAEANLSIAMGALETFAIMVSEDHDHLPDELLVSLTYDSTAYDAELGGPNELLGERFLRAFRQAALVYRQLTQTEAGNG